MNSTPPPSRDAGGDRPPPGSREGLLEAFREGRRVALARAISIVENERSGFQDLLHALLRDGPAGGARLGITGPPGAGKSSLVSALAHMYRERGDTVGIVAVDPTSPYSGGALLGDRIRMNELATDPGIFIRSMASRGSLGGLATTTKEVMDVMEAFGFPRLIVETVGVGQTELEITGAADTVVVVLVPESGDAIQAMKAGLMEIADIFVVNKADRPGADRLVREIRSAVKLRSGQAPSGGVGHHGPAAHHGPQLAGKGERSRESKSGAPMSERTSRKGDEVEAEGASPWVPSVVSTVAHAGEGADELLETVERHRTWLVDSGELERRRRRRVRERIQDILDRELKRRVRASMANADAVAAALDHIAQGKATPYSEAARILRKMNFDAGAAPLPHDN